mgnify:CR=1 FL=1
MAFNFNDMSLKSSGKKMLKLPQKFGDSEAKGAVVEMQTNNLVSEKSFLLSFWTRKVLQNVLSKRRSKIS